MYSTIYTLSNQNGQVFYVGQTIEPDKRLYTHRQRFGIDITMEAVDRVIYPWANYWELFYIHLFKSWGFVLKNKTVPGNAKPPRTSEFTYIKRAGQGYCVMPSIPRKKVALENRQRLRIKELEKENERLKDGLRSAKKQAHHTRKEIIAIQLLELGAKRGNIELMIRREAYRSVWNILRYNPDLKELKAFLIENFGYKDPVFHNLE